MYSIVSHCRTRRDSSEPLNPASSDPETFHPFAAWGNSLEVRVFSFVVQVDGIGDPRHRLDTDKVTRLARRRGRVPDQGDRKLRSEHYLNFLLAGLDPKVSTAIRIALQIGESSIEIVGLERKRIGQIVRFEFTGSDQTIVRDYHLSRSQM